MKSLLLMNRDDGEDEDEAELGLDDHLVDDIAEKAVEITVKGLEITEKVTGKATGIVTDTAADLLRRPPPPPPQSKKDNGAESPRLSRKRSNDGTDSRDQSSTPEQLWKRVTDTRGLPEQDASVYVKSRKTLKQEIIHNKNLLHKMTNRMFDDRMFIVNEEDPGFSANEKLALNNAIGTNKHKNPMVAKMAEVRSFTLSFMSFSHLFISSHLLIYVSLLSSYFSTLDRRSKVSKLGYQCGGQVSISLPGAIRSSRSSSCVDLSVFCAF